MKKEPRIRKGTIWYMKRPWSVLMYNEPVLIVVEKFLATNGRYSVQVSPLGSEQVITVPVKAIRARKR